MQVEVVYLTNIPAPYREKIHELVFLKLNMDYHVIYSHTIEPDRLWKFKLGKYSRSFLKKSFIKFKGRFIHINFDVWGELNRLNPKVVITTGFNPTFLFAFLWCQIKKKKHIPFSDGWLESEKSLTILHFLVRKIVYSRSKAFLGASSHTLQLYRHYGCPDFKLFQSFLCANNENFLKFINSDKIYDIAFSGQIIPRKLPHFFAEVAIQLKAILPGIKVLIIGDGIERTKLIQTLSEKNISFYYAGFVQQEELPKLISSAKVFLFPTLQDPWGVVANEACAAGLPVVTCSNAGAANDLVIHNENGYVLDLEVHLWCEYILKLLNNIDVYTTFSKNALNRVQRYNYSSAADGIVNAVNFVRNE